MKKLKVKKGVYYFVIAVIVLIIAGVYGMKKYKEYKYHQTYEYKLLENGYKIDEVNIILKMLKNEEDINIFLNNKYNEKYVSLLNEKYFLEKNFSKYIEYLNNNKKLDANIIVRNINIHRDQDFYGVSLKANTTLDTSMLVNKYYLLDNTYNPSDLVTIKQDYAWGEIGEHKIRQVAYDAFLEMWNAAYEDGYYLMVNSSYRTYEEQEYIYNNYKDSKGEKYADGIAARPGASEHQTGLSLDIFSKTNSNRATFKDSGAAAWLKDNSYKYGFILRYPEELVNITGYNYESWHFRYVGKEIAEYIYENKISFEEYYAYFIEK